MRTMATTMYMTESIPSLAAVLKTPKHQPAITGNNKTKAASYKFGTNSIIILILALFLMKWLLRTKKHCQHSIEHTVTMLNRTLRYPRPPKDH